MIDLLRRKFLSASSSVAGGVKALSTAKAEMLPQPSAGPRRGGSDPGPRDPVRDGENPDLLNPPRTDHGTLPNLRFSFADAHVRQTDAGWTRQITQRELGISTTMAGVNMRLNRGAVRELHWHKESEWSYMLYGSARITAVDGQGRNFVDDVHEGDLWYFPSGIPHSIQGIGNDGCEFLLVFDDGSSTKRARSSSATGSSMYRLRCLARISVYRRKTLAIPPTPKRATSFRCWFQGR
jgi:oxalate decarboxylase